MRSSSRGVAVSLAIALTAAVGACTSSSPSADPSTVAASTVDTGPTASYIVVAGDALSAIASRHGVSLDELVAANGWPDGAAHLILAGDPILLPVGATPASATSTTPTRTTPTSARADGSPVTTTVTADAVQGHYVALGTQYAGPLFPDTPLPITLPLVDGVYEAGEVALDGADGSITFTLFEVIDVDACHAVHGTNEDACVGYGEGRTTVPFDTTNGTVTVITEMPIEAYSIDVAEFQRLLAGRPASADAPVGFQLGSSPYSVTVRNGIVVAADQHFAS